MAILRHLALLVAWMAASTAAKVPGGASLFQQQQHDQFTSAAQEDQVQFVPGWGAQLNFRLYTGYITVSEEAGRAFWYAFAESTNDPKHDPLVLWLNGGPGCASSGDGFLREHGPFRPLADAKSLQENKYSWNSFANMLYLDTPAWVGFSYSNSSEDNRTGDSTVAFDNRAFLLRWLERFPSFANNDLYLAGESYAGHYLPTLADLILKDNEEGKKAKLNLKGLMVGNPDTDPLHDNRGRVTWWMSHSLISNYTAQGIIKHCDFAELILGPLDQVRLLKPNKLCEEFVLRSKDEMGGAAGPHNTSLFNVYDVYADKCLSTLDRTPTCGTPPCLPDGSLDPCTAHEAEAYLNRREVQIALHANLTELPGPYSLCTDRVEYSKEDQLTSMVPLYQKRLLEADLRVLIYSGDTDAMCPVLGTTMWINSLELEVKEPWRAWLDDSGQIGGYVTVYDKGLTFSSVRNAGHMVAFVQPERAFRLVSHWLAGKRL